MFEDRIARIFRATSPKVSRPRFEAGWEVAATDRSGDVTVAVNREPGRERFAAFIECYKFGGPSGASRYWGANHGFVAVAPLGEAISWTDRFGNRYEAKPEGIRQAADAEQSA